ncbi:MAG: ribonuclease HI family protein [Candidatus Blackburnbacteria bacterium]|nr:ribonuclease HI family protein [Candidatus Blackburnbacteria bacterium]
MESERNQNFSSTIYNNLKVFSDGGARGNPGPAASAFVVKDFQNNIIFKNAKKIGNTTNNIAEYTAVVMAMDWLVENKKENLAVNFFLDSQLVVNQLKGLFKIKNENLRRLVLLIKQQEVKLKGQVTYQHIPREKNKEADLLVNKALDSPHDFPGFTSNS